MSQSKLGFSEQMKSFNQAKQYKKTLQLFDENKTNLGGARSRATLFHVLKASTELNDLKFSSNIEQLISTHFNKDPNLLASLIHLHMQCGDVHRGELLFNALEEKSEGACGAMMKGYMKNNQAKKAIDLFKQIEHRNAIIYVLLFNACARLRTNEALDLVQSTRKAIPQHFYSNSHLVTSMVDALAKCGDISSAQELFNQSTNKTVQMHNALMKGLVVNNEPNRAIEIFKQMANPDEFTYTILFNACAELGTRAALEEIRGALKNIPQSGYSNQVLVTSLVHALGACGDTASAQALFDSARYKDIQLYGALMKGYIASAQPEKAINIFKEIKRPNAIVYTLLFSAYAELGTEEVLHTLKQTVQKMSTSFYSDVILLAALLDALAKCGDFTSAQTLFTGSKTRIREMFAVMMTGFNRENDPDKAVELFRRMESEGIEKDSVTYLCLIKALAKLGDQSLSQAMMEQIPRGIMMDDHIQTALIDMWGRSGSVEKAKKSFDNLSERTAYGYTAMINAYGLNGMADQAIELYEQMPGDLVNEITYICLLNACSHAGLVDTAQSIFTKVEPKTERICIAMVDVLSRASLFEQAQDSIKQYEQDHSPSLVMYMALLSGARNEKNSRLAQHTYDHMKRLFPQSKELLTSGSILLANIYAATGDVKKAADLQYQMRQSGVKKKTGLSWTVVNGEIHRFKAHDRSHPRSAEIYAELEKISNELIDHGHEYDSSWITRPLAQDETVISVLCGHSERLAIAWNFVANPNASRIQVTKNLRVCGDCHRATKLIAAIRQCDIIVRDANRIHHFQRNGQCSCNDYF